MQWTVTVAKKALKLVKKLPANVQDALAMLIRDIEDKGPIRGNWANYGKLAGNRHHCHLKKGKTTYVAVWMVVNKEIKIVEVNYVGTHEKAPY